MNTDYWNEGLILTTWLGFDTCYYIVELKLSTAKWFVLTNGMGCWYWLLDLGNGNDYRIGIVTDYCNGIGTVDLWCWYWFLEWGIDSYYWNGIDIVYWNWLDTYYWNGGYILSSWMWDWYWLLEWDWYWLVEWELHWLLDLGFILTNVM